MSDEKPHTTEVLTSDLIVAASLLQQFARVQDELGWEAYARTIRGLAERIRPPTNFPPKEQP